MPIRDKEKSSDGENRFIWQKGNGKRRVKQRTKEETDKNTGNWSEV